jgi:acyl carrier protein phosphodiesterase
MNYLGHIYLSFDDHELATANLFGDFVKGKNLSHLPTTTQLGIQLHREIDSFTDQHGAVKEILQLIRQDLPKVAPIAIDLIFDHLLAKNWNDFHNINLDDYLAGFYNAIAIHQTSYPDNFQLFAKNLVTYNWIAHYPTLNGLTKMSHGVSKKLSFENALTATPTVFLQHEKAIKKHFDFFISDASEHFNDFKLRNLM